MDRQDRTALKKTFTSFDVILGLGVLAVVAAGLPWLGQQLDMAKNARSRDHAGRVAQAILDYHTEMGQWPAAHGRAAARAHAGHDGGHAGVADRAGCAAVGRGTAGRQLGSSVRGGGV